MAWLRLDDVSIGGVLYGMLLWSNTLEAGYLPLWTDICVGYYTGTVKHLLSEGCRNLQGLGG